MLDLTCTAISSVDLAQYGVSLAKDWVSLYLECGTNEQRVYSCLKNSLLSLHFSSITLASIVDSELKAATNNLTKRFTIFAPNDSFITTMPSYGQDRLFSASSHNLIKSVGINVDFLAAW